MRHVVIKNPVINSPFSEPQRHFKFDEQGITNEIVEERRRSEYFIPIPKSKRQVKGQTYPKEIHYEMPWENQETRIDPNEDKTESKESHVSSF